MPQHDMVLANADGATFRADANSALAALVANSSGATAPATMFAYMFWADTTTGLLKQRNAANSAWITIGTLASANLGLASLTAANSFTAIQKLAKGADVASANALTLGTDGNYFNITGTTSITSIGTLGIGTVVRLHFNGILTLTHHSTDLVLPGAASITTAAGDEAEFVEYASADWRCVSYTKASGAAVVSSAGKLVAVGYAQTTAVATGTGTTPNDDTIPQIGEGNEYLTLAHTAAAAANLLLITVTMPVGSSASGYLTVHLHVDAVANAIASTMIYMDTSVAPQAIVLQYKHAPGDASAHTYRVRMGDEGGDTKTINGFSAARKLGGTFITSISILEYTP